MVPGVDSVSVQQWQKLFDEALRQSPESGNGFGFGMAVMVTVAGICVVVAGLAFWHLIRSNERISDSADKGRKEARSDLKALVGARFDRLDAKIENELGGLQERVGDLDRRVYGLEIKLGLVKPPKEGGE